MEKRTVLAIVISIVFILIWQKMVVDKVNPGKAPQTEVVSREGDNKTPMPVNGNIEKSGVESPKISQQTEDIDTKSTEADSDMANVQSGEDLPEQFVTLENQFIKLKFTNKGGRLLSAQIKGYKDESGREMELVNPVMAERSLTPFSTEGKLEYLNKIGFKVGNEDLLFWMR